MRHLTQIDEADVRRLLDYPALIDALAEGFHDGATVPLRHHHTIETEAGKEAVLLIMPAWRTGHVIGVKTVTVFPDNSASGLPGVMGTYMLLDGRTGTPRALIDGQSLTVRRTAAASALAARYLARDDAATLLMVGTGSLAPELIAAHSAVRPISKVLVWGRRPDRADELAEEMRAAGHAAEPVDDLEAGVRAADVVSCATMAHEPLVRGDWLRPGQHLDLVGAFTPAMRESDDECVRRAEVYVDTIEGALKEGGDIVQPINDGVIGRSDIKGDLFALTRGEAAGRERDDAITLFKSVGTALEDLVAAELAYARASDGSGAGDQ